MRLLVSPEAPRTRRITDAFILGISAVALLALSSSASPPFGYARAVDAFVAAAPAALDGVWQLSIDLLILSAAAIVVAALVSRRWAFARDLVVAAALAEVAHLAAGRVVTGSWPEVWASFWRTQPPPWFPSGRIAIGAAVLLVSLPYLIAPLRRVGRWLVAVSAFGLVALGGATSLGVAAGLAVAAAAAAATHLAFGSEAGRPSLSDVAGALAHLGVAASNLRTSPMQRAGVFRVEADTPDGRVLAVKVYGRDAHDSALLITLWRRVWFRRPGVPVRLGRLQQVEHEAFVGLFAAQHGVLTDTVVAAGTSTDDDALLALASNGEPLSQLSGPEVDAAMAEQLWALLTRLRAAGIAHGQVDADHLVLSDGLLGLRDFGGSVISAVDEQLLTDEVQALVASAIAIGPDRAVTTALDALGPDRLSGLLPMLQPAVLSADQARVVREGTLDLGSMRQQIAEIVGIEPPELQQLQRVTLGSVMGVLLPAVALTILISGLIALDWTELRAQIANATWWLLALGVAMAQVPRLSQAVALLGASPRPIPLSHAYGLQLASSYISVAVPSIAGRLALNIRFFQRHGMNAATALTAGGLDGVAGFAVQIVLLAGLLLSGGASLDLDLDLNLTTPTVSERLVAFIASLVAASVVILAAVPRLRRFLQRWISQLWTEARSGIAGLRSPGRALMLFGGNLVSEVLFASALALIVASLGYPVGFAEILIVNIAVSLLAGLLPVPGGVGVTEAGLTFGLSCAGVPEDTAFAAALLYRLATFYIPPLWGYVAMRWLQHNEQI